MTELNLSVPEIHCDHCKMSIETAVGALSVVSDVNVDIEARTVAVHLEDGAVDSDTQAVVAAIEDQGYLVAD